MLIDFRKHPRNQPIETDICVIGAGAAGISLTQALIGSSLDVCLLETGGLTAEPAASALTRTARVLGDYGTSGCRLRFFGGSTNHWGGNNMPMAPLDFAVRPWIDNSGWPISFSSLEPWYVQANEVLNAGVYAYKREEMQGDDWPFPTLDLQLLRDVYWRLTPNPTSFAATSLKSLETAPNVRVILHATVTNLNAITTGRAIETATIQHTDGNTARIKARAFVIAAGALESSRLLLASRDVMPAGIGNEHDCVGRYFMMHPHVDIGSMADLDPQLTALFSRHKHLGVPVIAGVSPSEESQRTNEILNGAVMLQKLADDESGYVSMLRMREDLTKRYNAWRYGFETSLSDEFGTWVWRAITDIDTVISGLWQRRLQHQWSRQSNPDHRSAGLASGRSSEAKPVLVKQDCPISGPQNQDAVSGTMVISTRRFSWRPSAVSLDATGRFLPAPTVIRRSPNTSRDIRYEATLDARRSDNC